MKHDGKVISLDEYWRLGNLIEHHPQPTEPTTLQKARRLEDVQPPRWARPLSPRARAYRMLGMVAAVCFLLGLLTGLIAGCAQPPQNTPPIGQSPRDSVRVTAEREHAMFAVREQAESGGWHLVSASQFARIGVWYKADPFWTIGFPLVHLAPEKPDTVQVFDEVITVNGKSYTIHRVIQPGATLSYTWTDMEGPNFGRRYHAILCNIQPGDIYFAKYHHDEDWLRVEPLDMRRVR